MFDSLNEDACQEAYEIVSCLLESGEIVVSQDFLEALETRRNVNYKFNLNDINNIKLHSDTEKILTDVYLSCMATQSDKDKINKAIKSLQKVILDKEPVIKETGLRKITWSDRIRRSIFGFKKSKA